MMCSLWWPLNHWIKTAANYTAVELWVMLAVVCGAKTSEGKHLFNTESHFNLDISRQLACMKLGSRGKYQPTQYCWVRTNQLLGYLVHTCHLPIDIQQILQRSCCPVWVLQPIHAAVVNCCVNTAVDEPC